MAASERRAYRQRLQHFRYRRASRPDRAYAAAKFAVRGFSEALRHELQMGKSPVRLSVLHPGGVSTNIVHNSRTGAGVTDNARRVQSIERFDAAAKTTPTAAALRIIKGIEKTRRAS